MSEFVTRSSLGKILRVFAIILMGMTAVFTLLGGIGSSCVALGAEKYSSMTPLAPYKWLYQMLVVLTIAAALYGIRATIALVKYRRWGYKAALIALIASTLLAGIQMTASLILRGKSAPNDIRFYISLISLAFFLLLRIPWIWNQVGVDQPAGEGSNPAGGIILIIGGVMALTVHIWAAPTHTFNGYNFADVWHIPMFLAGSTLVVLGTTLIETAYMATGSKKALYSTD
jgi:hypothetical protein